MAVKVSIIQKPTPRNMKKTYLSDSQIKQLVQRGISILPPEEYSKLRSIGNKYNIELVHGKMANLQLWASALLKNMAQLPKEDDFRSAVEREGKWYSSQRNGEILLRYIKYLEIWDSEYEFLNSPRFDDLEVFTSETIEKFKLNTLGEENIFIKNGGDYYGCLSQYDKSQCDKSALEFSTHLKNTLDSLFINLPQAEKIKVGHMVLNHASNTMDTDQFHNTLYAGQ
jgi:hypothetical protein